MVEIVSFDPAFARLSGSISKAGSHTFTLHLNRKARRIVRRYHSAR